MDRRTLIKSMLAGGALALTAEFGVSKATAHDIIGEFQKDLDAGGRMAVSGDILGDLTHEKIQIVMPGETMLDRKAVWYSVADVAEVWAKELAPQMEALGHHNSFRLNAMCRDMAKRIDEDLMTAQVKHEQKVLVEVPNIRKAQHGDTFEIVAGLETKAGLFGERMRVGYIREDLVLPSGVTGSASDSDSESAGSSPAGAAILTPEKDEGLFAQFKSAFEAGTNA